MTGSSSTYRVFAAAMFAVVLIALSGCVADTQLRTLTPNLEKEHDSGGYPTYGGR